MTCLCVNVTILDGSNVWICITDDDRNRGWRSSESYEPFRLLRALWKVKKTRVILKLFISFVVPIFASRIFFLWQVHHFLFMNIGVRLSLRTHEVYMGTYSLFWLHFYVTPYRKKYSTLSLYFYFELHWENKLFQCLKSNSNDLQDSHVF